MSDNKKNLYLLLGISLITQATTSLIGGLIGVGPFTDTENIIAAMHSIAGNTAGVYTGILLQIITALVIMVLGTALYQAGKHINKTAAIIALCFYFTEAILHIICQIFIFALAALSRQFMINGDVILLNIVNFLFISRNFCGAITMMPFGLGAIIFYYLIMKAKVIPRWLGLWGLITVPFILVGWSLEAFGISVPFALYLPYVPWEWVAGGWVLVRGLRTKKNGKDSMNNENIIDIR